MDLNPETQHMRHSHAIFENLPRWTGESGDYSYILNFPALKLTKIGICPRQIVAYRDGQIMISEAAGNRTVRSDDKTVIKDLRDILIKDKSYFCMGSIDLNRKLRDSDLPLLLFIQPGIEIHLNYEKKEIFRVFAENPAVQDHIEKKIRFVPLNPECNNDFLQHAASSRLSDDWHGESDESFLSRIRDAVAILKQTPSKMVLTRSYHKKFSPNLSPFDLYRRYALMEPNCAASHYLQMPDSIISLGCSPENIFEIISGTIRVDGVAATRAVVPDPEKDARYLWELQNDPKEQLEFEMTVKRYCENLREMCMPESIRVEEREIRKMRNVRHLRAPISGRLREGEDFFDVLQKRYPALDAHKPELIPLADRMQSPARFYGGIVGYLSEDRQEIRCFQNLRTALIKADTIYIGGGAGIIQDSRPELELLEVRNKLQCLADAIAQWERASSGRPSSPIRAAYL